MDHAYNIFTLANGLRVVSRRTNGLVSYIGAVINAGSRDEAGDCHGLSILWSILYLRGPYHGAAGRYRRVWKWWGAS